MKSITYGEVDIKQIAKIISDYVSNRDGEFEICIGTDSQNFNDTKMVLVIAIHNIGHGGIFFYDIMYIDRITSIKQKLFTEAILSTNLAEELKIEFELLYDKTGFDYTDIHMTIHVDAGYNGKSNIAISDIANYISSYGYELTIKPDSYAASSIANKFSK